MPEEPQMLRIDGVVVTIPEGQKAYFVSEVPGAFGKRTEIKPFKRVPPEERIAETMEKIHLKEKLGKAVEELKKVFKR